MEELRWRNFRFCDAAAAAFRVEPPSRKKFFDTDALLLLFSRFMRQSSVNGYLNIRAIRVYAKAVRLAKFESELLHTPITDEATSLGRWDLFTSTVLIRF